VDNRSDDWFTGNAALDFIVCNGTEKIILVLVIRQEFIVIN
jgi:hypothetical protein